LRAAKQREALETIIKRLNESKQKRVKNFKNKSLKLIQQSLHSLGAALPQTSSTDSLDDDPEVLKLKHKYGMKQDKLVTRGLKTYDK
jgi:hypothetical protein